MPKVPISVPGASLLVATRPVKWSKNSRDCCITIGVPASLITYSHLIRYVPDGRARIGPIYEKNSLCAGSSSQARALTPPHSNRSRRSSSCIGRLRALANHNSSSTSRRQRLAHCRLMLRKNTRPRPIQNTPVWVSIVSFECSSPRKHILGAARPPVCHHGPV